MTKSNWKKLFEVVRRLSIGYFSASLSSKSLFVTSWRMILFVSSLAVIVIYSSHRVDQKVFKLSKLNEELKDLRSKHIDMRTQLMSLSKTTKVAQRVEYMGLFEALDAPFEIKSQH